MRYFKPHGGSFTILVANLKCGSDPSRGESGNPQKQRSTVTFGVIHQIEGGGTNARLAGAIAPQTASFVVHDNNFTTGRTVITIGQYQLINNIDYQIGGGVDTTATNIAAAIDLTPEFSASATGATVTVECDMPLLVVGFSVAHYGTHTNFNALTPSTGFLAPGGPTISAPSFT